MKLLSKKFTVSPETFIPSMVLEIECDLEALQDDASFYPKEQIIEIIGTRFLEILEEAKESAKILDESHPSKEDLKETKEKHNL